MFDGFCCFGVGSLDHNAMEVEVLQGCWKGAFIQDVLLLRSSHLQDFGSLEGVHLVVVGVSNELLSEPQATPTEMIIFNQRTRQKQYVNAKQP